MRIEPFTIYIFYMPWENGGKNRPVLVFLHSINEVSVYSITTKYEDKSEAIKQKYFKINDITNTGLIRQSYVDTITRYTIPQSFLENKIPIGKLSNEDIKRFMEFLH